MKFNKRQLTEEEFDSLSQLDRIEFRLKYNDRKEELLSFWNDSILSALQTILGWGIIVVLLTLIAFPERLVWVSILSLIVFVVKILFVLFMVCLIVDGYNCLRWFKFKKELIKEYFIIKNETKKARNKRS